MNKNQIVSMLLRTKIIGVKEYKLKKLNENSMMLNLN